MGIKYDLYANPPRKEDGKKPKLHARVVTTDTAGIKDLTELIQQFSSLSSADIKAALIALTKTMVFELSYGRKVHLEGLGVFELSLSSLPAEEGENVRSEMVWVKNVVFRPEKELKKKFQTLDIVRVERKNHSKQLSEKKMDKLLTDYFKSHPFITRLQFQQLCGLTRSTAIRRINTLIAEGKLRRYGFYRAPLYVPMELQE